MNYIYRICLLIGLLPIGLTAQTLTEDAYYKIVTLPIPEGVELEVGGLTTLPNGDIAAATRRGDVWIVENPYMENRQPPFYRKFASGLHEVLGLAYKEGTLYLAQRGELTRLWDKNGDRKADFYESVYAWPISGHYHEYSYGPVIAEDGSMFVTGNVAFGSVEWWRGESRVPWRGWTMRITPEGEMEPWATGMRSPCGLAIIDGEFFYADNQGDWMGSGGLVHVEKGDFTGHPAGLRWTNHPASPVDVSTEDIYSRVDPEMAGPDETPIKPEDSPEDPTIPLYTVAEEIPEIKLPAVWLPHSVLGISTSQMLVDKTGGEFGPFEGQIFIGDQGQSKIDRIYLEKVNGVYQGAAFAFREGFQSGVLRMTWGNDGSLFVGQTNRGWGSTGPDPYGLQRLIWTGKIPFEMKTVSAKPDGFEISFTQPIDKRSAVDPASYQITSFIYKYHPVYGSPVVNDEICPIKGIQVAEDGLSVRLVVDNLRKKYIHEINASGVKAYAHGKGLLHPTAYYTLNEIPSGSGLDPAQYVAAATLNVETERPVEAESPETPVPPTPPQPKMAKRVTEMPASWTDGPDETINLGTEPGLKYDQKTLTVEAGAKIKWTFNNVDDMPHNCVIVLPGTADQVGEQALKLGVKGMNMGYIPETDNILYHTKLLQPGTSENIYFIAPEKPGQYTYVCTYPGHHLIMRGVLNVVK